MILEACVESFQEASGAEKLGASRIELCADLHLGGITPSYALINAVKRTLSIPVMVMIRPRGGSFHFTRAEIRAMEQSIDICREIGVAGIVTGILSGKHDIDLSITRRLVERARPMKVTFHKAIDETRDILESTRELATLEGLTGILSSGGALTARDGADTLNKMIRIARGGPVIIAAGRITQENLDEVSRKIHTREFHGRRIVGNPASPFNS